MTHRWKGAALGIGGAILVLAAGTRTELMGARPAAPTQTVNVQMIGDEKGNRFVPASITIHGGDVVTWTNVSGAHNVVFWPDSIPAGTQSVLQGKMSATMGPLTGPCSRRQTRPTPSPSPGSRPVPTSTTACPTSPSGCERKSSCNRNTEIGIRAHLSPVRQRGVAGGHGVLRSGCAVGSCSSTAGGGFSGGPTHASPTRTAA